MRHQPDDTADQSASRRRSQRSGPDQSGRDASVFVPGYGPGRDRGPDGGAPGQARPSWHGSTAGRGPVRGYPPLPGQPPPMYPPGQFAAWNQRAEVHAASPAAGGLAGPGPGGGHGPGPADGGRTADSGYYGRDSAPHTEPGYSVLAVSDPAADVTSTQTWQAVGDGRASGTWAAPARPGGPASAAGTAGAGAASAGAGAAGRRRRRRRGSARARSQARAVEPAGGRAALRGYRPAHPRWPGARAPQRPAQ